MKQQQENSSSSSSSEPHTSGHHGIAVPVALLGALRHTAQRKDAVQLCVKELQSSCSCRFSHAASIWAKAGRH
jgi:hypothetical protein